MPKDLSAVPTQDLMKEIQSRLANFERAKEMFTALAGSNATQGKSTVRAKRHMSASARKRIAAAQRARWAKYKQENKKKSA